MSTSIAFSSIEHLLHDASPQDDEVTQRSPLRTQFQFLTLDEAAFLSQQPMQALLAAGEAGTLTLLVRTPPDAAICLYNERTAETAEPAPMRSPNVVVLPSAACRELQSWKRAQVTQASLAGSLSTSVHGDSLRWLKPNDCADGVSLRRHGDRFAPEQWTHWKLSGPGGSPVSFDLGDLRLFRTEVEHRYDLAVLPLGKYMVRGASGAEEERDNYKSDLLQYANQAALKFWGPHVDKADSSTYPPTEKIVEWFMDRDDALSESLAKSMASIIRPHFAGSTRVSKEPKADRDPPRKRVRPKS